MNVDVLVVPESPQRRLACRQAYPRQQCATDQVAEAVDRVRDSYVGQALGNSGD